MYDTYHISIWQPFNNVLEFNEIPNETNIWENIEV